MITTILAPFDKPFISQPPHVSQFSEQSKWLPPTCCSVKFVSYSYSSYFNKPPIPPKWRLLGSPMQTDSPPANSMQKSDDYNRKWPGPRQGFKPTLPEKSEVDERAIRCRHRYSSCNWLIKTLIYHFTKKMWQWLWLSWQSGFLRYQRSAVRIQSSARFYN